MSGSKRKSFLLHIDSLDVLDDLTDEQAGSLFKSIKAYHSGEDPELKGLIKIAFSPFKNQFLRDEEKYEATCKARAISGSKGGSVYSKEPGIDNFGEMQFYVLRLYNEDEDFIKIGITSSKINRRFSGPKNMPYNYEIVYQVINDSIAMGLESGLEDFLFEFSYQPDIKFPGHTECFTRDSLQKLVKYQPFAQARHIKAKQSQAKQADSDSKNIKPFLSNSVELRLANHLWGLIFNNNPSAKKPNLNSWPKDFDMILRVDGRDVAGVKNLIEKCQQDDFWRSNILSPKKLREKYDQLTSKLLSGSVKSQKKTRVDEINDVFAKFKAKRALR